MHESHVYINESHSYTNESHVFTNIYIHMHEFHVFTYLRYLTNINVHLFICMKQNRLIFLYVHINMYNVYTLFQQNKYIIFCTWSRNSSSALFLWNCKWYVIIVLYCSDKDDRCKIILSRQNWSWIQVVLMILDDDKVTQITFIVSIQKKIVFWVIHFCWVIQYGSQLTLTYDSDSELLLSVVRTVSS